MQERTQKQREAVTGEKTFGGMERARNKKEKLENCNVCRQGLKKRSLWKGDRVEFLELNPKTLEVEQTIYLIAYVIGRATVFKIICTSYKVISRGEPGLVYGKQFFISHQMSGLKEEPWQTDKYTLLNTTGKMLPCFLSSQFMKVVVGSRGKKSTTLLRSFIKVQGGERCWNINVWCLF